MRAPWWDATKRKANTIWHNLGQIRGAQNSFHISFAADAYMSPDPASIAWLVPCNLDGIDALGEMSWATSVTQASWEKLALTWERQAAR